MDKAAEAASVSVDICLTPDKECFLTFACTPEDIDSWAQLGLGLWFGFGFEFGLSACTPKDIDSCAQSSEITGIDFFMASKTFRVGFSASTAVVIRWVVFPVT